MKTVGIITARGGSKRVPRKNLAVIGGLSAIEHTVINALDSGIFDSVIISTDDLEISEKAIRRGAEFNSLRPAELSNDFATTLEVMSHEVSLASDKYPETDYFCCLYPMTPLLSYSRVREGLELLERSSYDYVFSAKKSSESLDRAMKINASGNLEIANKNAESIRTQDAESYFFDAGQFYWGRKAAWLERSPILSGNSNMVLFEKYEVIDVDDMQDLSFVRELYKMRKSNLIGNKVNKDA
jgi:N-acylneuraminate cytidylyltransferase